MSLLHFTVKKDGFCGLFSPAAENRNAAVIILEDGSPDSFLVKTALKWINRMGVSAMGVGPEKSMKGVHSWPLENIENAVSFLQSQGYDRVGVCGAIYRNNSTTISAGTAAPKIQINERIKRFFRICSHV